MSRSEFEEAIGEIQKRVDGDMLNHADFFEWSFEQRNYMAIKEQMYQIAREFGWTLRGGRL